MGNKQSNDDFSRNPNFNMNQHQQAMRNLQANYTDIGLNINGDHYGNQVRVQQTEFKSVHRSASLYKPSIDIHHSSSNLKISFKYDSDQGSKLQIYIGVKKVQENPDNHITTQINSELKFQEMLPAGSKTPFEKEYPLNSMTKISGSTVILRVISLNADERTEYSLKNIGKQNWKILLEKLQINGMVTQLHNIYRSGHESDQCIICFTQTVNTMIEPCNHLCLCYDCCEQVKRSSNTCPICRSHIQSFKKIKSSQ